MLLAKPPQYSLHMLPIDPVRLRSKVPETLSHNWGPPEKELLLASRRSVA